MRVPRVRSLLVIASLSLGSVLIVAACSDPPPRAPVCLDAGVDPTCTPTYAATWDNLFTTTLQPTCAKSGVSCHASTGRQGGIDFDDREGSYSALVGRVVQPGRPECSPMIHRIVSTDGNFRMPPGANMPASDQCAVIRWIADGAKR